MSIVHLTPRWQKARPLVVKGEGDSYLSVSLYGLTEQKAGELAPLAKSWIKPAKLTLGSFGFNNIGYDKYQRAYVLSTSENGGHSELNLELAGSEEHPVINPAFVIKDWRKADVDLFMNGEPVDKGKDFRVGHQQTSQGRDLIVWINKITYKSLKLILVPVK